MAAELDASCADLMGCDPELVPGEHRLLEVFADLRSLTRRRHNFDDPEGELLRSPQEYFHSYLRSLDAEAEGLPARFVSSLERALRHYGVDSLERTPALERACYRLFLSQQRAEASRAAVTAILNHRLERAESLVGNVGDEFREVLDRLIAATEDRDQVVADLAREVRYRYYDEPVIEAAREQTTRRWKPTSRRSTRIPSGATGSSECGRWSTARGRSAPWLHEPHRRREPGARPDADRGDGAPLLPRSRARRLRARSRSRVGSCSAPGYESEDAGTGCVVAFVEPRRAVLSGARARRDTRPPSRRGSRGRRHLRRPRRRGATARELAARLREALAEVAFPDA